MLLSKLIAQVRCSSQVSCRYFVVCRFRGIFRVFSCVIAFFVCFRGFGGFSCRGQCRIALQLTGCFADVVSPCNLPVAFTMPMLLLQLPSALAGALTRSNNAYVPLRISQSRVNWKSLRMASMERFFWSMEAFKARISLSLAITTLSSELAQPDVMNWCNWKTVM